MIAPRPSEVNVLSPAMNMPAIAIITVSPEMSTARPEVADGLLDGVELRQRPLRRSSRSRRR